MHRTNDKWKDFKHKLERSYKSYPLEELELRRDKGLPNDDWDVFIE